MPIEEFGATNHYAIKPPLPQHLAHKPVYAMPYKLFDGMHRPDTDARYLSVGLSQWSHKQLSLKIMRHDERWSRQAEEMPLHRVIDSAVFLAKVLLDRNECTLKIEPNLFTNQDQGFRVIQEAISANEQTQFNSFLTTHQDNLKDRFNSLHQLLNELKAEGKF